MTYYCLLFIGMSVFLYKFRLLSISNRLFGILLTFTFFVEIIAKFLSMNEQPNYFLYNLYIPLFYSLISTAFYLEIRKKFVIISILLFFFIYGINSKYYQSITTTISTNTLTISMILTSVWVLLYLTQMLKSSLENNFNEYSLFWVSCGLLFFNTSCLFVFGAFNFVNEEYHDSIGKLFTVVRVLANHIMYGMIILSLLNRQKGFT